MCTYLYYYTCDPYLYVFWNFFVWKCIPSWMYICLYLNSLYVFLYVFVHFTYFFYHYIFRFISYILYTIYYITYILFVCLYVRMRSYLLCQYVCIFIKYVGTYLYICWHVWIFMCMYFWICIYYIVLYTFYIYVIVTVFL